MGDPINAGHVKRMGKGFCGQRYLALSNLAQHQIHNPLAEAVIFSEKPLPISEFIEWAAESPVKQAS